MLRGKYVSIEVINKQDKSYAIKDKDLITIGEIRLIEYLRENRSCTIRIEFFKLENIKIYFEDALLCFIKSLFKDLGVFKINVLVEETLDLQAFINLNFSFEGILSCNKVKNDEFLNEFVFGIDLDTFENTHVSNVLRLKGRDIELKILTPEDAEATLDFYKRNIKHLKPYEPSRGESFYTLEVQKKSIVEHYNQFLNGTNLAFGIFKDSHMIGKIQLSNIVLGVFRNAFIGYSIDENEQGKGYMKEAVRLISDYAFNDMELHRLEATTLLDNIKSRRVLKACGFKEVGISEKYLFINGEWRDHYIFYKVQ